jgi:hypothetical protein
METHNMVSLHFFPYFSFFLYLFIYLLQAYKILEKLGNNVKENVKLNSIPHGTWLNYFQNLWSQVDEPFDLLQSLYHNTEALTLNEVTTVLTRLRNKTLGDNSINLEMLKYAHQEFVIRFCRFFSNVLVGEEPPERPQKAVIISVDKKGIIKEYENYRGIN